MRVWPRLAARNLRRHPGQAVLLLVALTCATGTLSLALMVQGSADAPWLRVWQATDGPHVMVYVVHDPDAEPDLEAVARLREEQEKLVDAPEVTAAGGPFTQLYGHARINGQPEDFVAEVRGPGASPVDQPLVTEGSWLGDGTAVVLEAGLAATIDAGPGDEVVLQGRTFTVSGVATTASRGRFPLSRPALAWVNERTAGLLRQDGMIDGGADLQLRITDPERAEAFVARHAGLTAASDDSATLYLETWRQRQADSHSDLDAIAATLFGAGMLVALLTVATAGVLVAGRMAAQIRQVGTLKAVGLTPRQVTLTLLAEHLTVAAAATALGLAAGRLLAPRLAETSVTILGTPEAPPLTWWRVLVVAGAAVVVVLLATIRPALRGARRSTLRSLAAPVRPPRRPSALARAAARAGVPLPGVLGLRSALRRPGRVLLNATGLALGVAMVIIALSLAGSLDLLQAAPSEPGHAATDAAVAALYDQVRAMILLTAGLLLGLSAINALIVAAFAARDSARNHAVYRALGATPAQTTTALIVSQMGACVLAVAAGIPLGTALFGVMDGGDLPPVDLGWPTLTAVAAGAPVVFALLVSVPARALARRPVMPLLTSE